MLFSNIKKTVKMLLRRVIECGVNIRSKAANALCFFVPTHSIRGYSTLINGVDVLYHESTKKVLAEDINSKEAAQ
jgi:hypothetical protein